MLRTSASRLFRPPLSVHILAHTSRNLPFTTTNYFPVLRGNHQSYPSSRIRMSTTSGPAEVIEHVVLFSVKESAEPSKINAMVNGLNDLKSLPMVIHLTAGPIHRNRSSDLKFTHMLHSRYKSKDELSSYSAHQDHLSVVRELVLPVCEDIMAVDWVAPNLEGVIVPAPGSAMRVQFLKLKEGLGEKEKELVFRVIGGMKEKLGPIGQISFGENFSPARAKGYLIASIGIFARVNEMDALDGNEEIAKEKERVRQYIDGLIVIDYVMPSPQSTSAM